MDSKFEIFEQDYSFPKKQVLNILSETCSNGFVLIRIDESGNFETFSKISPVVKMALITYLPMMHDDLTSEFIMFEEDEEEMPDEED